MNLKLLEYFIALVQHGSFSQAAQSLFISQPTLSKSIKKLEEELQIVLFERSTRTLQLTDVGELVYNQAIKIIESTDELSLLIADYIKKPTGTVKLGIPPLIGTLFFPKIAKNFVEKHPNIHLQLIEHGAKKVEYLVEDGQIDIGIVVLPVNNQKFHAQQIVYEPFKCFAHRAHPITKKSIIHVQDIKHEQFIMFNSEFSLHHLLIDYCKTVGKFQPDIIFQTSQWDVIAELVLAEVGITLLPASIYKKMDHNEIVAIDLQEPPMWELGLITKQGRYHSYAVKTLLTFLEDIFHLKNRKS